MLQVDPRVRRREPHQREEAAPERLEVRVHVEAGLVELDEGERERAEDRVEVEQQHEQAAHVGERRNRDDERRADDAQALRLLPLAVLFLSVYVIRYFYLQVSAK